MEDRYCLPDWYLRHQRSAGGAWAPWGLSGGGRGSTNNFNGFKDHLGFIYRMNLSKCIEIHDGCVNTIAWNDEGRLILSGSDDLFLKITDPFQQKVITSIRSGHRSNIFKAKFIPFSDDAKIISCSGDGQIMLTEVLRPETYGSFRFTCHQGSTATVETIRNEPFSIMSGGEDGTVRHFDIRTRTSCRTRNCDHDVIYKSCCGVSAMAVNQLLPYQMAVCCTDGVVRLMDRRYMHGGVRCETGTGSPSNRDQQGSFLRFSPIKPSHECEQGEERTVRRRITSVQFCPTGGDEVLVSYSGDSIYLFGVDGKQRGEGGRKFIPQPNYSVPEKCLKLDPKSDELLQNLSKTALEGATRDSNNATASFNRKSFLQRLRIRGDWSDTGPSARPIGVTTTSTGNENSAPEGNNSTGGENRAQRQQNAESATDDRRVETQTSEVGSSQSETQAVRRGRQATIARFSSLLNQMLVEQFAASSTNEQTNQDVQESTENAGENGPRTQTTEAAVSESNPNSPIEDAVPKSSESETQPNNEQPREVPLIAESDEGQSGQTSGPENTESKPENGNEVDERAHQDEVLSYEEQHRAYVKEVREEVANAPIMETTADDKIEGSSLDSEGQSASSNTLVFVRETSGPVSTSEHPNSDVMVYMSPTTEIPSENPQSNSSTSHVESSSATPLEQNSETLEEAHMETDATSGGVPQGPAIEPKNTGSGVPQGSQEGTTTTRTAEARWASVAGDLMGMIRSRNRARNNRIRKEANKRSRFLVRLSPNSQRRYLESDQDLEEALSRFQDETSDIDEEESEDEEQKKRDDEIVGLLGLKNAPVRMKFSGHRNTRTMIKQANFWGEDYVITGSDCGHIFFFERDSGKLVTILEADSHVVNCVQPHPSKCILASSGIDYNVKLWMPTGPPGLGPPPHMLELVERNVVMQRQTRDLITVPASFMLRLLAMATPAMRATQTEQESTARESSSNEAENVQDNVTEAGSLEAEGNDTELNSETTRDSDQE